MPIYNRETGEVFIGEKKERVIREASKVEILLEDNLGINCDGCTYNLVPMKGRQSSGKADAPHGPRIKIMKGEMECGSVEIDLNKDLNFSEIKEDDISDEVSKVSLNVAKALAVYIRDDAINFSNTKEKKYMTSAKAKVKEFEKAGGLKRAKRIADDIYKERNGIKK